MTAARAVNSNNQCLKVFVQRDYSEGTLVKFQTRFPTELEDRVGNKREFLEIKSASLYGFDVYSFSMNSYWIFVFEMCVFINVIGVIVFVFILKCAAVSQILKAISIFNLLQT
jgi:hypothetical protein